MMKRKISDVLDAAAALIEPEGAWTQGTIYRDAKGKPAGVGTGDPVCWCALGAIMHVGYYSEAGLGFVEGDLPPTGAGALRPLSAWNDDPERKQSEVVARLREAATKAREAGQ